MKRTQILPLVLVALITLVDTASGQIGRGSYTRLEVTSSDDPRLAARVGLNKAGMETAVPGGYAWYYGVRRYGVVIYTPGHGGVGYAMAVKDLDAPERRSSTAVIPIVMPDDATYVNQDQCVSRQASRIRWQSIAPRTRKGLKMPATKVQAVFIC